MNAEHYENFPVASLLCPPPLRPAVMAIYRYARTADDIADEGDATPDQRLADLAAYRADLDAVLAGRSPGARWTTVFGALAAHTLPAQPLHDLLDAFAQDVRNPPYPDRPALLDYCRRSANPVGRLLLHLYGVADAQSLRQSDAVCSALQLINFWQDIGVDAARNRIYVPHDALSPSRLTLDDIRMRRDSPAARRLVASLCDWARSLMLQGAPLALRIPGRAGWELRLVVQGGLRILDKIAAIDHATLVGRPRLRADDVALMAWRALPNVMTPAQYVQDKAAGSGSSFYYAFLFLPPQRRAAITAFYAFCREVDDVVDETQDPGVAATKLQWWRGEVAAAYAGRPTHPVTQALLPLASGFDIRAEHLLAVIDGCQIDLEQTRFLDFAGLQHYCHLVAGVVGEVAAGIFGRTLAQTTDYAHALGQAMQLTNIIRDVGDDARRGRIYLPLDELRRFDVKASEILNRGYSDRFTALMRFQAERAHATYDRAVALLPAADRITQKPGLMMANIYRTLLREIESQGFRVLHQRTSLTPLRKLLIAASTHLRGR